MQGRRRSGVPTQGSIVNPMQIRPDMGYKDADAAASLPKAVSFA